MRRGAEFTSGGKDQVLPHRQSAPISSMTMTRSVGTIFVEELGATSGERNHSFLLRKNSSLLRHLP